MSNLSHFSTFSNQSNKSVQSGRLETVTLYEEYRLIEKDDTEVNVVWRGVHLLLFFLAFVFGSFCTFCFHMLMYMFDDKCVLFPKLISLKEMSMSDLPGHPGNKLLYDYISNDMESLPVDFVSTHWVEKSTCYLPTYVPLLSGICGLIWTTMFLMCSSGSRTLTGLQRPWRILPTVFLFSLAMSGLSIYTSYITQTGLDELCSKLGELAGTNSCTYTINVATLAYERRIRGVYQATKLTILSAWLHTLCWIGAAFTALLRVILVVDFRLVKVKVDLQGNIEKMLERHEKHIRTDEFSNKDTSSLHQPSSTSIKVRFVNKGFGTEPPKDEANLARETSEEKKADVARETSKEKRSDINREKSETVHFISKFSPYSSETSLVPVEARKLLIRATNLKVAKEHRFIVELLHEIVDSIGEEKKREKTLRVQTQKSGMNLMRQHGLQNIRSLVWSPSSSGSDESVINREEAEQLAKNFRRHLEHKLTIHNFQFMTPSTLTPDSLNPQPESTAATEIKSNLKSRGVQTEEDKKSKATTSHRVQIASPSPSEVTILTLKPPNENLIESTITVVASTAAGLQSADERVTPVEDRTPKPDEGKKPTQGKDFKVVFPNLLTSFFDEDTETIRPIKDEEKKSAPKKERETGIIIRDDEEPGPSGTDENQDASKKTKEHPKKTDKKEKQD